MSTYTIKVYQYGHIMAAHEFEDYDRARRLYIKLSDVWQQYPELWVDGVAMTTRQAEDHLHIRDADRWAERRRRSAVI